ncbi:MAG: hypothetical protein WBG30_05510 [Psychrilyobacter sp.]
MKKKLLILVGVLLLFSMTFANESVGKVRSSSKVLTYISNIIFEQN